MTAARGLRPGRPVAVAAAAAIFVAILGATVTDLGAWYQQLAKPAWQPPDWLFGPAWTLIYALIAMSASTGWRNAPVDRRDWVIGLFCFNGFLNILWSLLFFRLQRPDWALAEVAFLWGSIVWLQVTLWPHSRTASQLLLPYLAWVSFAAVLNLAVVQLNAPF